MTKVFELQKHFKYRYQRYFGPHCTIEFVKSLSKLTQRIELFLQRKLKKKRNLSQEEGILMIGKLQTIPGTESALYIEEELNNFLATFQPISQKSHIFANLLYVAFVFNHCSSRCLYSQV